MSIITAFLITSGVVFAAFLLIPFLGAAMSAYWNWADKLISRWKGDL